MTHPHGPRVSDSDKTGEHMSHHSDEAGDYMTHPDSEDIASETPESPRCDSAPRTPECPPASRTPECPPAQPTPIPQEPRVDLESMLEELLPPSPPGSPALPPPPLEPVPPVVSMSDDDTPFAALLRGPRVGAARVYPRLVHDPSAPAFHGIRLVKDPLWKKSKPRDTMKAFCGFHKGCAVECSLNVDMARPQQGRPLGFLWAWLSKAPHECKDKVAHELSAHKQHRNHFFPLDVRLAARAAMMHCVVEQEAWPLFEAAERYPWPGEGQEPDDC